MTRRRWNPVRTWFGMRPRKAMDPQVEAAIDEARQQDRVLRNEAAKVIAHRAHVAGELEAAAKEVAEGRELAEQALIEAERATGAGDAAGARTWTNAADNIVTRLQDSQRNLDAMQDQLALADRQIRQAHTAVRNNALRLGEVAARRMRMLGQREAARMQATVDKAMATIGAEVAGGAPPLDEILDEIGE